jgi:hypothetical protein
MASSHNANWTTLLVCAAASGLAALSWADAAFASQGPGGGQGTASAFTQLAMAVLVYGMAALVVGAGLIGAARRRWLEHDPEKWIPVFRKDHARTKDRA